MNENPMRCLAEDRMMKVLQSLKRLATLSGHSHVTRYESLKDAVYVFDICPTCQHGGFVAYVRTSDARYTLYSCAMGLKARSWEEFSVAQERAVRDAVLEDYETRRGAAQYKAKDN